MCFSIRSNEWNDAQKESYRILNSSYHNLTVMTYDHVLARAKRILGLDKSEQNSSPHDIEEDAFDDINPDWRCILKITRMEFFPRPLVAGSGREGKKFGLLRRGN